MSEPALELDEAAAPDAAPGVVEYAPPPPYVRTEDERARWHVCLKIAETVSIDNEPDGLADPTFVFHTTRELYHSDAPTGTPADMESDEHRALLGPVPTA